MNSSFYKHHRERTYRKWREQVGNNFVFTLKAHRDITHVHKMRLEESADALAKMRQAYRVLGASVLLLQTPSSFKYSADSISAASNLLGSLQIDRVKVAWETRGPSWQTEKARKDLERVLSRWETTHVVDVFKQKPVFIADVPYFRLHGLGKKMYDYKFSDVDLLRLADLLEPYSSSEGFVFFNNYEMYDDASRFLHIISERSG